jgi:hypothetical protein
MPRARQRSDEAREEERTPQDDDLSCAERIPGHTQRPLRCAERLDVSEKAKVGITLASQKSCTQEVGQQGGPRRGKIEDNHNLRCSIKNQAAVRNARAQRERNLQGVLQANNMPLQHMSHPMARQYIIVGAAGQHSTPTQVAIAITRNKCSTIKRIADGVTAFFNKLKAK